MDSCVIEVFCIRLSYLDLLVLRVLRKKVRLDHCRNEVPIDACSLDMICVERGISQI